MNKIEEAMKWLGIGPLVSPLERTYATLIEMAKAAKAPIRSQVLAEKMGAPQRTVTEHLSKLRETGRAACMGKHGWIPMKESR
jgi:predicted ArsR family transcriptional regulator